MAASQYLDERKQLKNDIKQTQDLQQKQNLQAQYWELNWQVKRSTRVDKQRFIHNLTEEAETAAGKSDMKRLYEITRTLSGKKKVPSRPVKDKNGETITDEAKERARWAAHFQEIVNRPPPQVPPDILPVANHLDVNTNPPTKTEVSKVIKSLKCT